MSDQSFTLPSLPARDPRSHKGTFGTVAVIGGCGRPPLIMIGAPAIAAHAALRAGCGLVRLAMPGPILAHGLTIVPSATGRAIATGADGAIEAHEAAAAVDELCGTCDALVVGPGLGMSDGARALSLRAVWQQEKPVVIDADAINCLAEVPELHRDFKARAVLTPHPGEYRRLAKALGVSRDPVEPTERQGACEDLARRVGAVVVLKGANTVVSDGLRSWVCSHANAALATAGTGDTLSGLIGSLLAQCAPAAPEPDLHALAMQRLAEKSPKLAAQVRQGGAADARRSEGGGLDLFTLACIAVEAHSRAAAAWRAERRADAGLLAMELADQLPAVLAGMRAGV